MSTSLYLGVDNGLTGAICALSTEPGLAPVAMTVMPVQGKSKGNEVDCRALWKWLAALGRPDTLTAVLETPGKHSPGAQALCSMWDSYGAIRAVLAVMGIKTIRITPQSWQKKMLVGCAKGETKAFAQTVARQLWPAESFLATSRSTKPHEGLIDSVLIAEYGRREKF